VPTARQFISRRQSLFSEPVEEMSKLLPLQGSPL
jgi:hypothetical protein